MKKFINNQKGMIFVEATFVFPVIIVIILLFMFVAIVLSQKVNINNELQNISLHLKPSITSYNIIKDETGEVIVTTKGYNIPYEKLFKSIDKNDINGHINKISKNINLEVETKNYFIYKVLHIKATKSYKIPIAYFLPIPKEIKITCYCKTIIDDPDELIRNVDYGMNLLGRTDVGEKLEQIQNNISNLITKG